MAWLRGLRILSGGNLIAVYGQSNAQGLYGESSSPASASAGTDWFNGTITTTVPSANGIRELLNGVVDSYDGQITGCGGAISGVKISALSKGAETGYYEDLLETIAASGKTLRAIIWHQGEGDADGTPTSEASYIALQAQLHTDICADAGVSKENCPFILCALGKSTGSIGTDQSWDDYKRILPACAEENQYTVFSHYNDDATLRDNIHLDAAAQGRSGARFARTLTTILGDTSGYPRFDIASSVVIDATTTDVTVSHRLGTDFTPTAGITGFEASGNNGADWVSCTGERTDATTIRLTHSSLATDSNRKLRHLYGKAPTITDICKDNSSLLIPLSPSAGMLSPTPLSVLPVPTKIADLTTGGTYPTASSFQRLGIAIGTADNDRFVIISATCRSGATLTNATIKKSGESDVSLTVVQCNTTNGSIAFAYGVVSAAYGTTADLLLQYASSIFSDVFSTVYTVDQTSLDSLTPVASAGNNAGSATSVSTTIATTAGGFVLLSSLNNSTGSVSSVITADESFSSARVLFAGGERTEGNASGVSTAAASSLQVDWTAATNVAIGAISFR